MSNILVNHALQRRASPYACLLGIFYHIWLSNDSVSYNYGTDTYSVFLLVIADAKATVHSHRLRRSLISFKSAEEHANCLAQQDELAANRPDLEMVPGLSEEELDNFKDIGGDFLRNEFPVTQVLINNDVYIVGQKETSKYYSLFRDYILASGAITMSRQQEIAVDLISILSLYSQIRGNYSLAELTAAGTVETLLGEAVGSPYPLIFAGTKSEGYTATDVTGNTFNVLDTKYRDL